MVGEDGGADGCLLLSFLALTTLFNPYVILLHHFLPLLSPLLNLFVILSTYHIYDPTHHP